MSFIEETIETFPAVSLREMTILPGMIVHFDVTREQSLRSLAEAASRVEKLFLVTQKDPRINQPVRDDLFDHGCVAVIKNIMHLPHGLVRVMVEGLYPARLVDISMEDGLPVAKVLRCDEEAPADPVGQNAMCKGLKDLLGIYARETGKISREIVSRMGRIEDAALLVREVSANLPVDYLQRQRLLDAEGLTQQFDELCVLLSEEIELARIRNDISEKVKQRIDKNQREYYLREQIKVISEELGDDLPYNEADQYRERLKTLTASDQVKERIDKEIRRFKSLGGNTAEASVSRTYIETLLDMPWDKGTTDSTDLKEASRILEEDHYGLEKVKERILEYLAVRLLTQKGDSPILCLAGPPGTGKTSIARSVARALGRKYVRISLGGIRDEAEIRGHRRTYIGAMPGRIAAGLRSAGVNNPLMLLDEVDKLTSSYNGDPSAALLEVLDSEQNCRFSDHYIEIPVDLSQVMFIATANDLNTVPRPLLDRMEVIEISSYTENEKLHIAREHLIEKQMQHHGLREKQLSVTDRALKDMIAGYTKEAGVRQLERRIGQICRKAARQILEENAGPVKIKGSNLEEYLGRRIYREDTRNARDEIGIVRGLAWTSVGGVTLQVEVGIMPGKGEFVLTGQLGDVMKESARAGISYIRSVAGKYGIDPAFFGEHDIHIHIPEGAVPKDGPSAGITMATAILSAITAKPVRRDVAMTGEITLRGRVLPIGGLKEKMLAARKAGMKTVVVPLLNKPDVEEISDEIKEGIRIVYASGMEQVLEAAFA